MKSLRHWNLLILLTLVICVIFIFLGYFLFTINTKINELQTYISQTNTNQENIKINESSSGDRQTKRDNAIVVKALTDKTVTEEIEAIQNFTRWPLYTSKLGIKFNYPQGLGCEISTQQWEISESKESIKIYDCNTFSGTFTDHPIYEIKIISGSEALNPMKYLDNVGDVALVSDEIFGTLYSSTVKGIRETVYYIPPEVHSNNNGTYIYYKFILRKSDEFPNAVKKMIDSIRI